METQEIETESDLHKAHLIQTLQGIQYINSLDYYKFKNKVKGIYLPPSKLFPTPETTKTVIFDLGSKNR
jgi:hypothetical protein